MFLVHSGVNGCSLFEEKPQNINSICLTFDCMMKKLALLNIPAMAKNEADHGYRGALDGKREWGKINNVLTIRISSMIKEPSYHILIFNSVANKC